jgi:hypothetical protein
MAVAVVTTFNGAGATAANYDASIKKMGCFPGGTHPDPGCLFHWVELIAPHEFVVTDVWKSQWHWQVFLNNILIPSQQGGPIPAGVSVNHEVHNYLTAGGLDPV